MGSDGLRFSHFIGKFLTRQNKVFNYDESPVVAEELVQPDPLPQANPVVPMKANPIN
jgi:hypothetical protein